MNLPAGCDALDGIRMAVISDLHLGCATPPGWLEETLRRIKEARADIILLDGDLSDGRPEDRRSDLARLGTLEAPLGVWAVPGNHEYYVDYAGIMAALPDSVHVLANSHARLRTSRGTFVLAGVTDRKARARGLPGPDIEKALSGLSGDGAIGPVLLMSHRPAGWSRNAARGVVLQICGHTHGGQFIWNRLFLRLIGRRYLHGLFERNSSLLWVGSGASQWFGFPLRVGVPPRNSRAESARWILSAKKNPERRCGRLRMPGYLDGVLSCAAGADPWWQEAQLPPQGGAMPASACLILLRKT